jgi:hypothetical protein
MTSSRAQIASFGSLAALWVLLAGPACVSPLAIFSKTSDAVTPIVSAGGYASVSGCASFSAYQTGVDPIFQRLCISCHGSGGQGAAVFQLTAGDSTDNDLAAANFLVAREKAVPTDGGTSSSDPDGTSPLLERISGSISHPLTLDVGGDDYSTIKGWVEQEIAAVCVSAN